MSTKNKKQNMSSQQINLERHGMSTVIDKEVALASAAQGLAPAGAMPPLMVGMLAQDPKRSNMFVGAPVMPGNHARAAPLLIPQVANKESDDFSASEVQRRIKEGGFYDHERMHDGKLHFDMMQVAAISGNPMAYLGEANWSIHNPQVPESMKGLQGRSSAGGPDLARKPRWQRGSVFERDIPASAQLPILRPNYPESPAQPIAPARIVNTASASSGKSMLTRGHA